MANRNPDYMKNLTHFTSTYQPENKGRKPAKLKKYIKETNLGIADQVNIYENIIATHTALEIMKMIKTKKDKKGKPLVAVIWGYLISWIADCKKGWSSGGINAVMLNRKHGRIPEKIKLSGTLDVTHLTPEERKKQIEALLAKRKIKELDEPKK